MDNLVYLRKYNFKHVSVAYSLTGAGCNFELVSSETSLDF